ncbi:MAG: ATP-binding protein [candidate division KSB1 bacterium]|nr:ATP-binding protein [candidate division KSB1 bacterium]
MEKLKQIIKEYEEIQFEGLERGYDKQLYQLNSALTIVGPRRSGKTTYLREIIKTLGLKHFLFLNFEDERIVPITDFDLFIEAYYELYHEKPHIFLDEVQNTQNWHLKVRRLIDQNYKVFVTGSNANLLSSEIATHLAGRTFIKRILPFSFREYLMLRQIPYSQDAIYGKERFLIKNGFQDFLSHGGFPEVIKTGLKKELLRQYFEIVFYKDIIVRHGIRQEAAMRLLIQKLVENIGKSYNVNNLRNRISQILSVSKQSLFDYLQFLEESFFVVHINNYQKSFLQRETERKTFFIDNGFLTILSLEVDQPKLFENQIFLELQKAGKEIYYFRMKEECDFIVKSNEKITDAIQVCWELTDWNREREVNGLIETMDFLGLNQGLILTNSQEDKIELDGKRIDVKPAWKWLLEKSN